jgi:hypothetical protein
MVITQLQGGILITVRERDCNDHGNYTIPAKCNDNGNYTITGWNPDYIGLRQRNRVSLKNRRLQN